MSIKGENGGRIVWGDGVSTYVFEGQEEMSSATFKSKVWQIFPSICVSLVCIPFGIMLGWPSPTYILLLSEESPLPITIVQSPMIAGFLMFGNIFATPLSSWTYVGSKYAILISLIGVSIGWTLMWQATNIYFLLTSRFIIGFGNGYAVGHVKNYITELCEESLAAVLLKTVNLFLVFGVLVAFILGTLVDFRTFSLVVLFFTVFIFFVCFFLPHPPAEYLRFNKVKLAKKLLRRLKPQSNAEIEIAALKGKIREERVGICGLFREPELRTNVLLLGITTFVQQFSGAPASIVYCQFIFQQLQVPRSDLCAIFYGFVFLFCNVLGTFVIAKFSKKTTLFISCLCTLLSLIAIICIIRFKLSEVWECLPLVSMIAYIGSHTLGLGVIPFTFAEFLFPKRARLAVSQVQIMLYSIFAVIITKLFQVFYSAFDFYCIFCLFASVATFGCVFIITMIPKRAVT